MAVQIGRIKTQGLDEIILVTVIMMLLLIFEIQVRTALRLCSGNLSEISAVSGKMGGS